MKKKIVIFFRKLFLCILSLLLPFGWVYVIFIMVDEDPRHTLIGIFAIIFLQILATMTVYKDKDFLFRKIVYKSGVISIVSLLLGLAHVIKNPDLFELFVWIRVGSTIWFYLVFLLTAFDGFYEYIKPRRWVNKII